MYCIVLSIKLFSYEEWRLCFNFRNLQACGIPCTSICWYCSNMLSGFFNNVWQKAFYATNMFLSLEMDSARICLFLARLQPIITILILSQPWVESHPLLCILKSSFFLLIFFRMIFLNPFPNRNVTYFDYM